MKKTLKEQLERIHTLTYGKKVIKEGFLDDLFGKKDVDEQSATDSKKSDVVGKDNQGKQIDNSKLVEDFYATIENAISSGGLKQEGLGSMQYKKEVESMQIALSLLGFELPQYGVDGLFGPETANAVNNFKQKYGTLKESAEDVRSTLNKLGYKEKGSELASGGEVTDQVSSFVDKVLVDFKAVKPDVKVTVTGGNDKFHKGLGYESKHTTGQAVDLVIDPYNEENSKAFIDILNKYKSQDSKFNYIDEYKNPSGAATAGHFHLQYGEGTAKGGPVMKSAVFASPEMLTKLLELVKEKNIKPDELRQYMNKVIRGNNATIDIKDWQGIVNTVIDNLEGGYYHPDMLQDGRVNDSRFSNSGETMFGMDRQAGGTESQGPAGQEFWRLIDAEDARHKWKHEYMLKDNPQLDNKLRQLVAEIMKPLFVKYVHSYLSPDAATIVTGDPSLTFNFAYAVWNGPGWFQKFAKPINDAVASGTTDPKQLLQIALEQRTGSGNSLIAQSGIKVSNIANRISSTQPSMDTIA